jgi:glycosyltransferase involved in cell wall biosynthesis
MKNNKNNKKNNNNNFPFISVCTPTFNRRPFIPYLVKCFLAQTYPLDRVEWIIVDDGTDCIKDLIDELVKQNNLTQIKYHYYKDRMTLGKKRNVMHSLCSGDIIVYMDDDDYYPPERISHAVNTLENNKQYLIAGSSEMHIYFKNINKIYQFGPYKENHSTAATFAFRKELLLKTSYDDNASLAEETQFLKNYTIPLIQLNVLKTILVFSHCHNSFDKNILLEKPNESKMQLSSYSIKDFILHPDPELTIFYTEQLDNTLSQYEQGDPKYKPDVLNQIQKIQDNRAYRMWEYQKSIEIQQLKNYYEKIIQDKNYLIQELINKLKKTL